MTLHYCFIFKLNMNCLILNCNAIKIDLSHHFYIYIYKAVTFQILYYLLNTILLLSFISHCLILIKHLKTLYLLSLSL